MITDKQYLDLLDRLKEAEEKILRLESEQNVVLARVEQAINSRNSGIARALARHTRGLGLVEPDRKR